jgi:hypothetical protein
MNKRIKARWLRALRSGRYKQGTGNLQPVEGKFCCLGVLCDLHAKSTGGVWEHECGVGRQYLGADLTLPDEVWKWAGLKRDNPRIRLVGRPGNKSVALSDLNDGSNNERHRTFKQIANLIERHL